MPLTINDGKATPAAHAFTQDATQVGDDPAEFVNRSNANGPNFWERIKGWFNLASKASQPYMYKYVLTRPIAGTVNGVPAVLGRHQLFITLLVDQPVASASDVKDTWVMGANMMDNPSIVSQVQSFAPPVVA